MEDIRSTAAALQAPFDEEATRKSLAAYVDDFRDSAVVWKTTGRPGDDLSYRFYKRTRTDTLATAIDAGLLPSDPPLAPLINFWSSLYDGAAEQSCDFTARTGLDKTWVWLGGTRPATDVLDAEAVPDALRRTLPAFAWAGLAHVRFLAVDHRHHSVNIYFRVQGPVTPAQCANIVSLARVAPLHPEDVVEMRGFMPQDYGVSASVCLDTGEVARVCFYALNVPEDRLPRIPERIATFLTTAPSYDTEGCTVIGWSFGPGNGTYIKAERSCFGDMISAFERWSCHFSGSRQQDPALPG
ncbi:aromatic prenyltransferase [Streptomyces albidochromogenes]|uniref:Aromatic prenyltransferase n=1 Tax=Streptomyces albidochromogenes TaxID=329524 RepID=A0ABW6FHG5_9ACTN